MSKPEPNIQKDTMSVDHLQVTKSLPGQEYCAFVYLLVKNPETPLYGVTKVLCTGSSMDEVENHVTTMIDNGTLEKDLPSIKICRTGHYKYLLAGASDNDQKEAYNVQTKEKIIDTKKIAAERRKNQIKETNQQIEDIRAEEEMKILIRMMFTNFTRFNLI